MGLVRVALVRPDAAGEVFGVGVGSAACRRGHRGETGQVMPLVVGVLMLVVVAMAVVGVSAQQAVARSRLQVAADAVALAGAATDRQTAERVATLNGATVTDWQEGPARTAGGTRVVTVSVGPTDGGAAWQREMEVSATAEELAGPVTRRASSISPELLAALRTASDAFGELIIVDVIESDTGQMVVVPGWAAELLVQLDWNCTEGATEQPPPPEIETCIPPS